MSKESKKTVVYSALEVANICGVVNQTVINWIKKGYLSAFSTPGNQYRVYKDDLISFMKSKNMRLPEILVDENSVGAKENILVIEDIKGLNVVLSKNFEREFPSLNIVSAFDAFEAGTILSEKNTDIVLIDVDVSGVNGIDLCLKIRDSDKFGQPEILVICSENSEVQKKLKENGFQNVFLKPVNLLELNAKLSTLL